MKVRELAVRDALALSPTVHADDRGAFLEWFRSDVIAGRRGSDLPVAQANCSVSRAGTLRGVHLAQVPPGQAKYVTCVAGAVLDLIVDLRVGSPTFGTVDSVRLDAEQRSAVYLPEGVGHAFLALTDGATVVYLCSTQYDPEREFGVNPLDPALALPLPADLQPVLSDKDRTAPSLQEARAGGLLPQWADCVALGLAAPIDLGVGQ